jgi:hypothetical protein
LAVLIFAMGMAGRFFSVGMTRILVGGADGGCHGVTLM